MNNRYQFKQTEAQPNGKGAAAARRERGFSLVEIMVAMAIGMISMLVVMQTFSASEAQKRTSTGGDDAQVAGSIGLFQIERDMAEAGYGLMASPILGCTLTLPKPASASTAPTVVIAPVTINSTSTSVPGGDTGTDTLLIMYGTGNGPIEGNLINSTPASTTYSMQAPSFFAAKDYIIAAGTSSPPAQAANCSSLTLDTVKTGGSTASPNIVVTTGAANVAGGTLFDLGSAPVIVGYAIRSGNLTSCLLMSVDCTKAANWSVVAGNIASMNAVYGHDANAKPMNDIVDTWDQTTPTTSCGWIRTSALSIALVARNTQYAAATGSPAVYPTQSSPVWADPAWASGTLTWKSATATSVTIDLSGTNSSLPVGTWQNYRYKLYDTVVPLRNATWQGVNYMSTGTVQC